MTKKDIHIVLSSSKEFLPYCCTTIISILENLSEDSFAHFYIISFDIDEKSKKKVEKIKKIKDCSIEYPKFDESKLDLFDGINMPPHVSKITFARCFIPDLLPDVDKALFIDCDTLVRSDITELFNIELNDHLFGAVEDIGTEVISKKLFDGNECYYTCGVLLINCKKLREINYVQKIEEIVPNRASLYLLCDQDVLNDVFRGKFYKISFKWDLYHEWHPYKPNFTPTDIDDYNCSLQKPAIIHFAGPDKPWHSISKHPYKKEYNYYFKRNPFYSLYKLFYIDKYVMRKDNHFEIKLKNFEIFSLRKYVNEVAKNQTVKVNILKTPFYKRVKEPFKSVLYVCGISILKTKRTEDSLKKYILGIPVYKHKKSLNNIKRYLFGIKFYHKNLEELNLFYNELCRQNQILFNKLYKKINQELRFDYMTISSIQATLVHKEFFHKYLNCCANKDVVLVGCGPTINKYKSIYKAIHVGVNRAFKKEDIKFDYIFAQDKFPEGMEEINKYPCTKFYGYLPNERIREVQGVIERISPSDFIKSKANKYIIEDIVCGHWAQDLSIEPIGDFKGCCFSALQFICYCNPQKIYLVGCDCSSEKNESLQVNSVDLSEQIHSWRIFKKFITQHYPDIEVISVNPVGLKGMFKDVYTEEYLLEHPEINRNDVEILNV